MPIFMLLLLITATPVFSKEETEGMRAMRLGCEKQRSALGCYNYANILILNGDSEAADKFYTKGCKLGHPGACSKEKWEITRDPSSFNEDQDPLSQIMKPKHPKEPAIEAEMTDAPIDESSDQVLPLSD